LCVFRAPLKAIHQQKTEAIQNQFKKENITLIEDETDLQRYTSKKVSKKVPRNRLFRKPMNCG
jgi:hypothetical protein